MNYAEKLGKILGEIRTEQQLTIQEMAARCAISESFYTNLVKGKHDPRFDVALRISERFDISLDNLIDRNEYAPRLTAKDRERSLGQTLAHIRSELNLSQIQMSGRCGININTYRDMENGNKIPRFNTIAQIAAEFDVSLDAFKEATDYAAV